MNALTLRQNQRTCAHCRYSARPCAGGCSCSRHGGDIRDHQQSGDCDFFPPPLPDTPASAPVPHARTAAPVAVPESQWPLAVKALALLRVAGERGVGDTLKRTLGSVGGDAIARAYEKLTGSPCGCSDRAAKLNCLYPYATVDTAPPPPPP